MNRQEIINHYRQNPDVSVLIIGAGINGIGTFNDLALQGVDVLIVDRDDFCAGASSASSRMVHGGIRYLENGEFRLVREAVRERNRMIENAPHYVYPLATTIPIFKNLSGILNAPLKFLNLLNRPSERGALVIKLGLIMYDSYTRGQDTVPRHEFLGRKASLREYPRLNPEIRYTATYYDAAMRDAERIAVELMLDGEAANPRAHAVNYVSAFGAHGSTVVLRDEETGEPFEVRPKIVINAAGPWIDFVNQRLGRPSRLIGGTKGSHIVIDHPELYAACKGHEIFFENKDGRIVLIYPLAGRVIVGTSDIKAENPDDVRCTEEEIAYFINLVKVVFPSIRVTPDQIVYTYVGVRPLPNSDAKTAGQISRDHHNDIVEAGGGLSFPIFNLVGGKWTSYRAFSEEVANETLKRLSQARRVDTANRPIGGGANYPTTEREQALWVENQHLRSGVGKARLAELFDRYGTRAALVANYIGQGDDRPLANKPDFSVREVEFIALHEKVVHILDLLQRRSLLAMMGYTTRALVQELAGVIGGVLDWSPEAQSAEVTRTIEFLTNYHRVQFDDNTITA